MILLLETFFLHVFIFFLHIFQSLTYLDCYLSLPSSTGAAEVQQDVEIPVDMALWGLPHQVMVKNVLEEPYAVSVLSVNEEAFFNLISESVNPVMIADVKEAEEEILTMAAWSEEPDPVAVTATLAASANAKISDHKIGEQLWIVEVVGEEQGYLHVSDGNGRAWVNSVGFGSFTRKDILSVLVDRKSDIRVDLLTADVLQKHTTDFSMADDLDCIDYIDSPIFDEVVGA